MSGRTNRLPIIIGALLSVFLLASAPSVAAKGKPGNSGRLGSGTEQILPVNLGPAVNTAAGESRPSLSADARQLLFGRAPGPEGGSDIYVTTR